MTILTTEGQDLRDSQQGITDAKANLALLVRSKRDAGWSWARIGQALGVSRQAVWERFGKADR
jgi:hypothetical protein